MVFPKYCEYLFPGTLALQIREDRLKNRAPSFERTAALPLFVPYARKIFRVVRSWCSSTDRFNLIEETGCRQ